MKSIVCCFIAVLLSSILKMSGQQASSIIQFPSRSYYDSIAEKSGDKPMYLLTYDHGGLVLWGTDSFARTLRSAISWLDKSPGFKIGLDNEAYTYDYLMKNDTVLLSEMRGYLSRYKGRFGIGTCTYGQPLSTFINEESNIRQIQYALETDKRILGCAPSVYLMSEHAMHSQIPQIIKGFDFTGAIMRTHFMMYGYNPTYDSPIGYWVGLDGSRIPAIPTYKGEGDGFGWVTEDNLILTRYPGAECKEPLEAYREKFSGIYPLLASRADDAVLRQEGLVSEYEGKKGYRWMLLDEIFPAYPAPKDEYKTSPNDFPVRMPWGYCGNEIWNQSRSAEVKILTAERLAALSYILGDKNYEDQLEIGWKNLLVAQHHDIQICGLLKDSRKFLPASVEASDSVIRSTLTFVSSKMEGGILGQITVFNPLSWKRKECIALWVKIQGAGVKNISILQGSKQVPFEILNVEHNSDQTISRAQVLIPVEIPALAFQSFSIVPSKQLQKASGSIEVDNIKLQVLTPYWNIILNPNGGITSIVNRKSGIQMVNNQKRNCYFEGVINGKACESVGKWIFDSSSVNNNMVTLTETGEIGGIPYNLKMRLSSFDPRIDYTVNFIIKDEKIGRLSDDKREVISPFLHEEKLRFKVFPSIGIGTTGIRDLPFAISETGDQYIQGNYWTAIADGHIGMAIFNKGTMGSIHEKDNGFSVPLAYSMYYIWNTVILNGNYEYSFAINPFEGKWENADLHRKAIEYNFPCVGVNTEKGNGLLGFENKLFDIKSKDVLISALYTSAGNTVVRMYESHGDDEQLNLQYLPVKADFTEINLAGREIGSASSLMYFKPWQIRTFKITNK
jgi:alpha-mannosidase